VFKFFPQLYSPSNYGDTVKTRARCKLNYLTLALAAITLSPHALGDNHPNLEQRIVALEAKAENKGDGWHEALTFSGVIEVEASYADPDSGDSESDLVVATAELGVDAIVTESLSTALVLLYEEDEGSVDIDIATINYNFGNGFSFVIGQEYVPFGAYGTALVSDPISLEFGETRETALITHYEQGGFNGAFYIFNGDNDEKNKQEINDYGVRVSFSNDAFTVGGDYISNLGNSGGLTDAIDYSLQDSAIAGAAIFTELSFGSMTIFAEHLSALDGYTPENNAEPSASQLEVAFTAGDFIYAASYQQTEDALFLALPENRISVGFSTEMLGGLGLGLELTMDDDYSVADGGTGESTNSVTLQLAAEF
jgi:hypothetical protein